MWIDTHTHFDSSKFDSTRADDWNKAQSLGVSAQFVMGVAPFNFAKIESLASHYNGTYFALGIHPMFVMQLDFDVAINELRDAIERNLANPHFIGIGEIGLDGFIDNTHWNRQVDFFTAQLKLARDYNLPVFMHIRKAQDMILKHCRQFNIRRGIAHAFNGSHQQADNYLSQGFKLGFGGAFTYSSAKQLRRLGCDLPLESFVLETDSPDMSPAWLTDGVNCSYQLPRIAQAFSALRDIDASELSKQIFSNVDIVVSTKNIR